MVLLKKGGRLQGVIGWMFSHDIHRCM